jgi:hypothetical protein
MEIGEGGATHVVDFSTFINEGLLPSRRPRVNEGLLAKMEDRISKSTHPSTGTNETGNNEKRCIFRLHRRLKNINSKLFEPQVISLGPYHYGKRQLQNMEELKWRCLASFMERRKGKLEECLIELGLLELEVRECYSLSETDNLSSTDELLQMMVVDGCFILMLFIRARGHLAVLDQDEMFIRHNPISWLDMAILPNIYGELENQIPSCVLKTLHKICIRSPKSLFVIATNFLWSISVIPKSRNMPDSLEWLHLLDLVRSIFISHRHNKEMARRTDNESIQSNSLCHKATMCGD